MKNIQSRMHFFKKGRQCTELRTPRYATASSRFSLLSGKYHNADHQLLLHKATTSTTNAMLALLVDTRTVQDSRAVCHSELVISRFQNSRSNRNSHLIR